jgi:hypothetical protein
MESPRIRISWGELIDRITILEIKLVNARNAQQREAVSAQLAEHAPFAAAITAKAEIAALKAQIASVNRKLWDVEDRLRALEREGRFDPEFVELARSVYKTNDERARLKREIDETLRSDLVEVKIYDPQDRK